MKKSILSLILMLTLTSYAQTGKSPSSAFTSIGQAVNVTKDSIYFFNIGGTTFSTFVKAGGWVQIAIDFGNGVGNLPQGTSLTNTTRGILSPAVLSKFVGLNSLRATSSTGNIDVTTTNANMLGRIAINQSLNRGAVDNSYYNTTNPRTWEGTGQANFISTNTYCNSQYGSTLNSNVFHSCGDGYKFNWMPKGNYQSEVYFNGDIPAAASFQLFARVPRVAILPIELNFFELKSNDQYQVEIHWQTASEKNNDFFTIERSQDGIEFDKIAQIKGAGTSRESLNYMFTDYSPLMGTSYYRLRQTDFDLREEAFEIKSITIASSVKPNIVVYPTKSEDVVYLKGLNIEENKISLHNYLGQEVTQLVTIEKISEKFYQLDISKCNSGWYMIKTQTSTHKIFRQ